MHGLEPPRRAPWALAVAVAVITIFVLGLLLDLGPFADEPLTASEYIAAADGFCRETRSAFAELQDDPPQTSREAVELTSRLLAIADDDLAALDGLEPPPALAAEIDDYLAAREPVVAALRAGQDAARAGDADAYREAVAEALRGGNERQRLARSIGLSECGR